MDYYPAYPSYKINRKRKSDKHTLNRLLIFEIAPVECTPLMLFFSNSVKILIMREMLKAFQGTNEKRKKKAKSCLNVFL